MKNFLFILTVIMLASCGGEQTKTDERQTMIAKMDSINKQMFDKKSMELNKDLAFKGITAFHEFAAKYPDESLSAEYLFRMADLQRAVGDNGKAIQTLGEICKKYPSYKKVPDCIFLQGYYYQEFFKDTTMAKGFYQELLSKYPTHPFADDAKALMSMFGKSEEDIIKGFEKKNS